MTQELIYATEGIATSALKNTHCNVSVNLAGTSGAVAVICLGAFAMVTTIAVVAICAKSDSHQQGEEII